MENHGHKNLHAWSQFSEFLNTHSLSCASWFASEKTDRGISVTQGISPEPGLRLGLWIPHLVPFLRWPTKSVPITGPPNPQVSTWTVLDPEGHTKRTAKDI